MSGSNPKQDAAPSRRRAPDRELLLANHRFPGEYIIKAFGPSNEAFRSGIRAAAVAVVGDKRANVEERTSRRGQRVCVTLRMNAFAVEEVIDVYNRIHEVPDLMLIL